MEFVADLQEIWQHPSLQRYGNLIRDRLDEHRAAVAPPDPVAITSRTKAV
jgi:hypothetical protein